MINELNKADFLAPLKAKKGVKLLGLDVGDKKVGLAIAELEMHLATPLSVMNRNTLANDKLFLQNIIREYRIAGIIVGVPLSQNHVSPQIEKITKYVTALDLGLPIYYEDESYTSQMADQLLRDAGLKRKQRNPIDDKVAAKLILDYFFSNV